ncbi:MAG TPA: hypothetical protein VN687_14405 [Blastocatellia bacterium]|nr:hypothetical protein [Blastocatellia bacterium]
MHTVIIVANPKPKYASIGLRAKTGRAIAVALGGPPDSPRVIRRTELRLTDPSQPATSQPYHEVMDLPWEEAKAAVRKISAIVENIASKALAQLVREIEAERVTVRGIGIAGAGNRDLEKIGSTHIRAHAAEGVLFRHVLEVAARRNKQKHRAFDERTLDEIAANELKRPSADIKNHLAEMGRSAGSPWRVDEKAAALAAWLALAGRAKK